MKLKRQRRKRLLKVSWGACVLLSVLFHLILIGGMAIIPAEWLSRTDKLHLSPYRQQVTVSARMVKKVSPQETRLKDTATQQKLIKTNEDQESATRPEDPKMVSNRNTRKEGGRKDPTSKADMPEVAGKERKEDEEIVLFDQDKRDGDLSHERDGSKNAQQGSPDNKPLQPFDPSAPPVGSPDGVATAQNDKGRSQPNGKQYVAQNATPPRERGMQLPSAVTVPHPGKSEELDPLLTKAKQIAKGEDVPLTDLNKDNAFLQPKPAQTQYDPFFSPESQPGFKTHERKTAVHGRFGFGRRPTLDVEATPAGIYQMLVYRAIGEQWYLLCDANRDLIVAGTIRIRIMIDKKGKVATMRQVLRNGASEVQKAFTFQSIKRAKLPVMPPEVVKEIIGDMMEMNLDFHF